VPSRRLRLGVAYALLALALALHVVWALRARLIYEPARAKLVAALERELGGRASVGALSGTLTTSAELSRGAIVGPAGLPEGSRIEFADARVRYSLPALARGDPSWLREVEVVRPRIEVDLARPLVRKPAPGGPKRPSRPPPLPRVSIVDATLVVHLPGGRTIAIEGVEARAEPLGHARIEARIASRTLPYVVTAVADLARLAASEVSGTIEVGGAGSLRARIDASFAERLAIEGEVRANPLDLGPIAALALGAPFPGGAPLTIEAHAERGAVRVERLALGARGALLEVRGAREADGAARGAIDLGVSDLGAIGDLAHTQVGGAVEAHAQLWGDLPDTARAAMGLTLALEARGLAAGGRPIPLDSLSLDARASARSVEVSSLLARAGGAVAWGDGALALEGERVLRARMQASAPDLGALAARLGRPVTGTATWSGAGDAEVRIDEAPLAALGDASGGAWISLREARLGPSELSSVHAVLEASGREARLEDLSIAAKGDVSAVHVTAHGRLLPEGRAVATIDSLETVIAEKRVAPPFFARAELDPDGDIEAVVSLPEIDLAAIGPLLPGSPLMTGTASLSANAGGMPGAREAALRADARDVGGYGLFARALALVAAVDARGVRVDSLAIDRGDEGRLVASGRYDFASGADEVVIDARDFDLAPIAKFLPLVRETSGRADAHVTLSGSPAAPHASGFVEIRRGAVRFERLLGTFYDIEAHLDLDDDRVTLARLTLRGGAGVARATGEMTFAALRPRWFSVAVEARNLLALADQDVRLRADAELRLFGAPDAMRLEGGLHVTDFHWYRDFAFFRRRPEAAEHAEAASPFARALSLDVGISSEEAVWVDNREALVRGTVRLHAHGTAADPRFDGVVSAVEGRVEVYDRKFRLERGTVSFVGGRLDDPWVDFTAQTFLSGVVVFVTVSGSGRSPDITMSSSPPLSQTDIVSLLTIGVTRQGAREAGAGSVAAGTAGRYLFSRVLDNFRGRNRDIGFLDQITVEGSPTAPGVVNLGQTTATPELGSMGVGGSQTTAAVVPTGPRFTVIYDVTDVWQLQAQRDLWGFYNLDLFYQWRFR
jgi:autotransporter translocation and assembly factor TamB